MRVAVMQPYLLPYVGYFQLLHSVDTFVLLDDVAFIKKGWVNRNQLLVGPAAYRFTIPLAGSSQNKLIQDLSLHPNERARQKLLATIEQEYGAASEFAAVFPLVKQILLPAEQSITAVVLNSLLLINSYVNLPVPIVRSSALRKDAQAVGQARIIAICQSLGATEYVNMVAGAALYASPEFARQGIKLKLLQPTLAPYPQRGNPFVPGLSIIDVLMYNKVARVRELFQQAVLLEAVSTVQI